MEQQTTWTLQQWIDLAFDDDPDAKRPVLYEPELPGKLREIMKGESDYD